MMAFIGDYVFLPYSHMDLADVGFVQKNIYFNVSCPFLLKENFTVDTVLYLLNFRPQAMMGGEITSYQKEEVPKFVKHLQEISPDLFDKVYEKSEKVRAIIQTYSYIGRKALLTSLTPNVGKFVDIHKGEWTWDGEYITSKNSKAAFVLVDKFEEIKIKPVPDAVVVITDNNQVNTDTVFLS
jgi:hypothetical protein